MQFENQLEGFRGMLLGKAKTLSYMSHWPKEMDSEDLVQNTLMKACKFRKQFKGDSKAEFRAWLLIIFQNEVNSRLRYFAAEKRDAFRTLSIEQQFEESESRLQQFLAADESAVSKGLQRDEAMQRLYETINRMSQESQQVLLKRYLSRMSLADIAAELKISVDSASKRLCRAIETLGRMVKGEESF